jgi:restriction system protein
MDIDVKDESSNISKGLFYMEQQLEDFIIENWNETEFGKKYDLIVEGGDLLSQQYRTDIGTIDILVKDQNTDDYVVIELKKDQTSDDTIGQISRYMGWVKENLKNDNVKGVIVCGKYDEKLDYALKIQNNIEVFLYEVNFSLKEYKK